MQLIYDYIFYIAAGWFVMEFEPLKIGLDYLYSKFKRNETIDYLLGVIECWVCSTFWTTLILTWDIRKAVIASFVVYLFDILSTWKLKK